jgi:hypothetical protein
MGCLKTGYLKQSRVYHQFLYHKRQFRGMHQFQTHPYVQKGVNIYNTVKWFYIAELPGG